MKRLCLMSFLVTIFGLVLINSCSNEFSTSTEVDLSVTSFNESKSIIITEEIVSIIEYCSLLEVNELDSTKFIVNIEEGDSLDSSVYTIIFGKNGFKNYRGNILKGKLIASYSNSKLVQETTNNVTLDHFSINDDSIKKNITVLFSSITPNSLIITTKDTIILKDGKTIISKSKLTRKRIINNNSFAIYWNDQFSITGTSGGINTEGKAYTNTIDQSNPLIINGNFPFFVKGTQIISSEDLSSIIDYGDGTKDSIATVTINGVTKEITVKR